MPEIGRPSSRQILWRSRLRSCLSNWNCAFERRSWSKSDSDIWWRRISERLSNAAIGCFRSLGWVWLGGSLCLLSSSKYEELGYYWIIPTLPQIFTFILPQRRLDDKQAARLGREHGWFNVSCNLQFSRRRYFDISHRKWQMHGRDRHTKGKEGEFCWKTRRPGVKESWTCELQMQSIFGTQFTG